MPATTTPSEAYTATVAALESYKPGAAPYQPSEEGVEATNAADDDRSIEDAAWAALDQGTGEEATGGAAPEAGLGDDAAEAEEGDAEDGDGTPPSAADDDRAIAEAAAHALE